MPIIALGDSYVEPSTPAESFDEGDELTNKVHKVLSMLPKPERLVFELRDIKGLSGPKIADELNISLEAQKSRIHRARAKVRELIDECVGCA